MKDKIVTVRINDRDNKGKIIQNKYTSIRGKCYFYGYNQYLECNMIVINRTPIFPITEEDIIKVE